MNFRLDRSLECNPTHAFETGAGEDYVPKPGNMIGVSNSVIKTKEGKKGS